MAWKSRWHFFFGLAFCWYSVYPEKIVVTFVRTLADHKGRFSPGILTVFLTKKARTTSLSATSCSQKGGKRDGLQKKQGQKCILFLFRLPSCFSKTDKPKIQKHTTASEPEPQNTKHKLLIVRFLVIDRRLFKRLIGFSNRS